MGCPHAVVITLLFLTSSGSVTLCDLPGWVIRGPEVSTTFSGTLDSSIPLLGAAAMVGLPGVLCSGVPAEPSLHHAPVQEADMRERSSW